MPVSDPRGPLTRALLDRLARRAAGYGDDAGLPAEDLELLRAAGYLTMAVPERFGGAGLTLPQVACSQRRLAYRAPAAALAVNAHHAWVGAAADAHAAGYSAADWVLTAAARGLVFTGPGTAAGALLRAGQRPASAVPPVAPSPVWDWLDGPPGDPFIAGVFGWGLPLDGELCYAMARRAFDQATERLRAAGGGDGSPAADPGAEWHLAEAALRLEAVRDQLDATLHCWRERAQAGGAVTSLDPGGQWLIRLFTIRHIAAEGAWRVLDLSAQAVAHPLWPVRGCAA